MIAILIRTALSAVALLAACVAGEAADLKVKPLPYKAAPPVAYHTWSGFYLGANGGWGFGNSDWSAPPAFAMRGSGALAGLTYGYNFQSGAIVWGVEGDIDGSDISASTQCGVAICGFRNSWLGTLRGRVGQSFDQVLPYVTGGLAYGDVRASNNLTGAMKATPVGWTIGAGLEFALGSMWSAKLEYLYVDLGSFNCGLSCGLGVPENVGFTSSIVRAGLNFKFDPGGPIIARY
jgi:outer membrane immunogenic protein